MCRRPATPSHYLHSFVCESWPSTITNVHKLIRSSLAAADTNNRTQLICRPVDDDAITIDSFIRCKLVAGDYNKGASLNSSQLTRRWSAARDASTRSSFARLRLSGGGDSNATQLIRRWPAEPPVITKDSFLRCRLATNQLVVGSSLERKLQEHDPFFVGLGR